MDTKLLLKYIVIATIFIGVGLLEGIITNPPPSQAQKEYQSYYDEQAGKKGLTQSEFEALKNKEGEFLEAPITDAQLKHLLNYKALFALIFFVAMFISYKYILKGTTIRQVVLISGLCFLSMFWLVSTFELIIYMIFCVIGALLGFKYNKSFNPDGAHKAPPG